MIRVFVISILLLRLIGKPIQAFPQRKRMEWVRPWKHLELLHRVKRSQLLLNHLPHLEIVIRVLMLIASSRLLLWNQIGGPGSVANLYVPPKVMLPVK